MVYSYVALSLWCLVELTVIHSSEGATRPPYYHYDPYRNRDPYRPWDTPTFYSNRNYPEENVTQDSRCVIIGNLVNDRSKPVTVKITQGVVEGRYVHLCDGPEINYRNRPQPGNQLPNNKFHKQLMVFLGIPYAEPPIGDYRFRPPQHPLPWGSKRTIKYKPPCPQHVEFDKLDRGFQEPDEDCLYLNVFAPYDELSSLSKLAVMVYIHGGGFWDRGSANSFPAHILAASQNVVVVTFNYRLGPLGFFSTADSEAPGNYGLMDQAKAIDWVYENIEYFNGDPLNITIFGSGAGAASAGLHIFSPNTMKLVRRIIAQSGSAVANWAVITDPAFVKNNSILYGIDQGCDTRSSWNLVKCLRSRRFSELTLSHLKRKVGWVTWGPVVDGYSRSKEEQVLPDFPERILENIYLQFEKDFAYMSGVTRDEAVTMLLEDRELESNHYEITEDYFRKKIHEYAEKYNYTLFPEALYNAIEFMYMPFSDMGHRMSTNKTLVQESYISMLSDSYFKAPNDKMLKLMLRNKVKTYMYVLNYTIEGITKPAWQGVPHDTEYFLLTGAPFMDPKFYPRYLNLDTVNWTEADRNMSQFFMEAWANFAKFGNPTPRSILNAGLWEPMSESYLQYLSINSTNMTNVMLPNYRQKESQFWNIYIPRLIQKVTPTWPPTLEPLEEELRIYQASLWGVAAAAGLFLLLALLFCCLFCCRSKSQIA